MPAKSNIVLIGMPACGKSTLGVQLAKWFSKGFIDTDLLVQARAGESMQEFQNRDGLAAYQKLECETVRSVVCENCVVATGGSAVYCNDAMLHLKTIATVFFLDVPLSEIKNRIGDYSERGVVMKPGMTLDDLYDERRPLYLKHADHVLSCAEKTPDELIREIRARLQAAKI